MSKIGKKERKRRGREVKRISKVCPQFFLNGKLRATAQPLTKPTHGFQTGLSSVKLKDTHTKKLKKQKQKQKKLGSLHPSNETYRNVFAIHKNKFFFF